MYRVLSCWNGSILLVAMMLFCCRQQEFARREVSSKVGLTTIVCVARRISNGSKTASNLVEHNIVGMHAGVIGKRTPSKPMIHTSK
jgi:hypothetical protein